MHAHVVSYRLRGHLPCRGRLGGQWGQKRGEGPQQHRPARGSAWEPYLREGARRRPLPEAPGATLWRRLYGGWELLRGLWRRRDVHGARQLSEAAIEVRPSIRRTATTVTQRSACDLCLLDSAGSATMCNWRSDHHVVIFCSSPSWITRCSRRADSLTATARIC